MQNKRSEVVSDGIATPGISSICLYRTGKKRSAGCAEILRYMKKTGVIRFFSLVVEPGIEPESKV